LRSFRRDEQAHRNHGRFEDTVASDEGLRFDFEAIGQQGAAKDSYLACDVEAAYEQ